MKLRYLILPLSILLASCSSDEATETAALPPSSSSSSASMLSPEAEFPSPDGSQLLSTTTANAVWKILGKLDPQRALQLGQLNITDEQYAEIKSFVDTNFKAGTQYDTYRNIFSWIVKNITYAHNGDAYLDPYDVFKYKRCVCQGYANLLKTMCLTQDIPCLNVNGSLSTLGGHAWNYVYADSVWYVSDPTNNNQYNASNYTAYQGKLIPQQLDVVLFEDDKFTYKFQYDQLNVNSVKPTTESYVVVPFGVNGLRITSFAPDVVLPASVEHLYLGSNIASFGDYPSGLISYTKHLTGVFIDKKNTKLESYNGIVYKRTSRTTPYYIPSGIRRLELRAMHIMEKNVAAWLDNVEEIVIASGTTRIEDYAFEGCPNLKKVYIPETVNYIAPNAFADCGNFEIIRFTTGITEVTM